MAQEPAAGTISTPDAAALLMVEARTVQRIANAFSVPRPARGRYSTVSLVQAYIKSLREGRKDDSRKASEDRVRDARAREFDVRTARAMGELCPTVEFEAVMDDILSTVKAGCIGLGAEVTRDLDLRRQIDGAVDRIFARAYRAVAEKVTALRPGAKALRLTPRGPPDPRLVPSYTRTLYNFSCLEIGSATAE